MSIKNYFYQRKIKRLKCRIAGLEARISFYREEPVYEFVNSQGMMRLAGFVVELAELKEELRQVIG